MSDISPIRRQPRQRLIALNTSDGERHASWGELFFDLVFVLAVAKVAAILAKDSDLDGFLKFVALFVPVWWAWVGYTFYVDRFESDKIEFRVMIFAAMLAVAVWAMTLSGAFTPEGDTAFAACYAAVLGVLILLYASTAIHVPLARALAAQFIVSFTAAVVLLLVSILAGPPVRYWLWLAALVCALASPFLNLRQTRIVPFDLTHIPERFGLFTIIVLGEAVVATANGVAGSPWTVGTGVMATLGFAMAACVWWINFEFVDDEAIRSPRLGPRFVYIYGHFFTVSSIVAMGIGVEHAITEAAENHLHLPTLLLLGGGVAVYLASIMVVRVLFGADRRLYIRLASIAASITLIAAGTVLPPFIAIAGFLSILGANVWLEARFADSSEPVEKQEDPLCGHAEAAIVFEPRLAAECEQCVRNNYKWVHLRLCLTCGHVGCCDSSRYKHATAHFHAEGHPLMASLEAGESWSWCYIDERYVPLASALPKR
jgi:low temperature requirement protein LtrA